MKQSNNETMKIAIVKYNAGNIMSVTFALQRLGIRSIVTSDHEEIRNADKVIFPGVGEAGTTMEFLQKNDMVELIKGLKQPVLGICLGMQLMCTFTEERNTECFGIFEQQVKRFPGNVQDDKGNTVKVPHMGWNSLYDVKGDLYSTELENEFVYFVHSYYVETGEHTVALTDHIIPFSASLQKDNFYATQFHPEKSGTAGEQILKKFIDL